MAKAFISCGPTPYMLQNTYFKLNPPVIFIGVILASILASVVVR